MVRFHRQQSGNLSSLGVSRNVETTGEKKWLVARAVLVAAAGMSVYGLWAVGTVRRSPLGGGVGGRWGRGLSFAPLSSRLSRSFLLPQHDVNEAADEAEGEGHPGHHVGVAKLRAVVRTHDRVDDGGAHHEHACEAGRKERSKEGWKERRKEGGKEGKS